MSAVLITENIVVTSFEQTILSGINLVVNQGDFIVLIGPNGSGKSTLLKAINGVMELGGGNVIVHGDNMRGLPVHEIARRVATLTQDVQHSTFSDLSVEMNLDLAVHRSRRVLSREEKKKYLATFSGLLPERLDLPAGNLSGGQRQALALAMCFAQKPQLLLLDEHTSALDPKAAAHLMRMTNEHVLEHKLSTIMITHSLDHVLQYGNRLIVMNDGKIAADMNEHEKQKLTKQDLIAFAY